MTAAVLMPKEVQQEVLAELAGIYERQARKADVFDGMILKAFGGAICKSLGDADILSITPTEWTQQVRDDFIDTALGHIRETLDGISQTWTAPWKKVLFDNFGDRQGYIKNVLEQVQLMLTSHKDLTRQ